MMDLGGTYRVVSPEETLQRITPLLWPVFGITRVANITGLDNLNIPTYIAIRPSSRILSTAQGKGITKELAQASAIMESVESWHAERLAPPQLYGSYEQLKTRYSLVDIQKLVTGNFQVNPQQLQQQEIAWSRGVELNSGASLYFPSSLIDLNSHLINLNRLGCFPATSNGLASGNSYEEAVCHGLFEVIERHSWAIADEAPARLVDSSTIKAPHLLDLLEKARAADVEFKIADMTTHLEVPAYSATLFDKRGTRNLNFFVGAGAHLSSVVALSRAITEAIQSRLTMISGSRDDMFPANYQFKRKFSRDGSIDMSLTHGASFIETSMPNDFSNCIHHVLARLGRHGYKQVLVFEHTREELGIPVVHVLIPGMAFDWFKHKTQAYVPDYFCDVIP